jgi:hypothetical protein
MSVAVAESGVIRSCFRFEDWTVAVGCTDPADLRWLAAFLDRSLQEVPEAPPDCLVELTIDAGLYDHLFRLGSPGRGRLVEAFANDAKPGWLRHWSTSEAADVFHHDVNRVFYVVTGDGARVTIVAAARTRKVRTALMRVVRELTMSRVVASGGLLVHGAAVGVPGGALVMCGPKRSGKTSVLMAMLDSGLVSYVANDRCVLRGPPPAVTVRGLPTLVSIRAGTLDRFPAARDRLGQIRPDLGGPEAEGAPRSRVSLGPSEFCELMGGCRREEGGPVRALLFPRVTDRPPVLSVRPLDPPEALARLRAGLFRAGYASPLGQVFPPRPDGSPPPAFAACATLAAAVPSFDCQLGGGTPPGREAGHALIRRVT